MSDEWRAFVEEDVYFLFVVIYLVVVANPLIYVCADA